MVSVLSQIKDIAHKITPHNGKVILYGSRARGDAGDNSDWDLLIVLDKDRLEQSDYDDVSFPFVMLGSELGQVINPIMYTAKEWNLYSSTPFYKNVVHDGINII